MKQTKNRFFYFICIAPLKDDSAKTFAQTLLNMGDGELSVYPSTQEISFPQCFFKLQLSQ